MSDELFDAQRREDALADIEKIRRLSANTPPPAMNPERSRYRAWDEATDAFLIEEADRRARGLLKAGHAKKVVTADPRGIFQHVGSLLLTLKARLEALRDIARELDFQRDDLVTRRRKELLEYDETIRAQDVQIAELRTDLMLLKRNEALLWTEVLQLRKLKAPAGATQASARVYFEGE